MGLMIKGEFTPEEIAFVENLGPKDFWTVVNLPEEAETYGAEPCAYYEKGYFALVHAISLLRLIDEEKAKLLDAVRVEIEQPDNRRDEIVHLYLITLENVKRIYELIRNMPAEMPQLHDDDYFLLPQYEEAVERTDCSLYHLSYNEKKKMIDLSVGQVKQLIKFLELAINKERDIVLDY